MSYLCLLEQLLQQESWSSLENKKILELYIWLAEALLKKPELTIHKWAVEPPISSQPGAGSAGTGLQGGHWGQQLGLPVPHTDGPSQLKPTHCRAGWAPSHAQGTPGKTDLKEGQKMQVEKRGRNTKVRGRGAPQQSRHSLQPMANPIPEQNTPDRNAAPRPHSGAEERGKEEGKTEKNCDGLIASPTAPFRWVAQESRVKLNLRKGCQKLFWCLFLCFSLPKLIIKCLF